MITALMALLESPFIWFLISLVILAVGVDAWDRYIK